MMNYIYGFLTPFLIMAIIINPALIMVLVGASFVGIVLSITKSLRTISTKL